MRMPSHKKTPASLGRDERLRKAHAGAKTLRTAFPGTALVSVQLHFLQESATPHAAQSFVLYPGARALFAYPCPYGDCDGIYELEAEAQRTLALEAPSISGTAECCGMRSRNGLSRQACGLQMSYSITAQRAPR
jgi:hypothetical protein